MGVSQVWGWLSLWALRDEVLVVLVGVCPVSSVSPQPHPVPAQLLLQVLIILTGNYNFFNALTIVLAFSLLDEEHVGRWLGQPRKRHGSGESPGAPFGVGGTFPERAGHTATWPRSGSCCWRGPSPTPGQGLCPWGPPWGLWGTAVGSGNGWGGMGP